MPLRSTLFEIYRALQKVVAPGLKYSQCLYEDVLNSHVNGEDDWLDVGCGHHVLPPWRAKEKSSMVGRCRRLVVIDANWASLRKHRSTSRLPFREESFDLVTAN